MAASLADATQIFTANKPVIDDLFSDLRPLLRANPELYDQVGDEITEIENQWERIRNNWPVAGKPTDETLARLARVQSYLDEVVFHCGLVTVPVRVNRHLRQLRSGQTLDFHDTFNDELPKLEHRLKLLQYINAHPAAIEGVVDPEAGLIYCASPEVWRRRASFVFITLTLLLGVVVVWLYLWFVGNDPPHYRAFLGAPALKGYFFITLGSLAHILINAVKQARSQTGASFRAIDDWVMWVHVKEVSIMAGIVSLWIGIIGLAWFQQQQVTLTTAFFVGYSIDSCVDLFLERFSRMASASTKAITEQITKAPA